jgi:ABC-type transport system substrate-binding protein
VLAALGAAAVMLVLTGQRADVTRPDAAGAGETRAAPRIYRHSLDEAPTNLDPVHAATVYANYVIRIAYDTLYAYKYLARPYELTPNLAAAMPEVSDDGLVYTIRLKSGARFIDDPAFPDGKGREVVAEDVVYSLKRHFDPASRSEGAWLWRDRIVGLDAWGAAGADYDAEVRGLRALDAHTLRIELTRPYPQLPFTLAQGFAAIVPREAVEYYGPELGVHPVGSGPYRVESFDTARVVLSANRGYRQEPVDLRAEGYDPALHAFSGVAAIDGRSPPFLDGIEIHFISDDVARWLSFTKGDEIQYTEARNEQVDQVLASRDPPTLKPELAEGYRLYSGLEGGFVYMTFNFDFPEIGRNPDPVRAARNKALRCAMISAFDWKERNERFYFGLGQVFPGVIPPVVPEFDPNLSRASVELDLDRARRLLAENGWTPETLPELVYGAVGSVNQRQMYEQFRGFMERIGYPPEKIVWKPYPTIGDLQAAWKQSELPLVFHSWSLDFPDAENTLQLFYSKNRSPGSNDSNYANPEYDRLFEQAAVLGPSPERTALYRRMNEILIEDCVAISGIARTRVLLWHDDVIAIPDREMVGGYFLKYVDLAPQREDAEQGHDGPAR